MAAKGASSAIRSPTSRASDRPHQGGRLRSEWVADFRRNRWPDCVGISGRFASDYAARSNRRTCRVTLIVQLGLATEELNRRWYEANTGHVVRDVQRQRRHPTLRWMGATLDGRVEATGAVFEAKFMLPWSFSEEAAAEKHMAQLQHNMWVVASPGGGALGDHRRRKVGGDHHPCRSALSAPHPHGRAEVLAVRGERRAPRLFGVEPPKPRIQAVRIVDMSGSNAWAEFAGIFARTRAAYLEHEQAKTELKSLMPEDAKEAIGHGVRAKRSKSGAVSFDLLVQEGSHAAVE